MGPCPWGSGRAVAFRFWRILRAYVLLTSAPLQIQVHPCLQVLTEVQVGVQVPVWLQV